jgi:hypothetical protein
VKKRPAAGRSPAFPVQLEQLNARPDPIDFRDLMFEPTLVEVPPHITLQEYKANYPRNKPPILDQQSEGACTGFGLAAVAHFLLQRRVVDPDTIRISPRMLYEMARRYDEWPGEKYSGSSARGAMKGWHKHGVCAEKIWKYEPNKPGALTYDRSKDAAARPLGAYFRVNHKNLVAMHAALAEVGILYATATVHAGWSEVKSSDGVIPGPNGKKILGGHAFAIVGYDRRGFWVQNSWGETWGKDGFALLTYADWLLHGSDIWVARLGAPVELPESGAAETSSAIQHSRSSYSFTDVRPHIIGIGNNGRLRPGGESATKPEDIATIFDQDIPRITAGWKTRRILLYAHGGLVGEQSAIERIADYRPHLLAAEVYPLAFIWKTDLWTTLRNLLEDLLNQRRPEGTLDPTKDFMLDRLDDSLETFAHLPGKRIWGEMKENALAAMDAASARDEAGGARLVFDRLAKLVADDARFEVHIAAHSAGSIFMGPIVAALREAGIRIRTCALWAPACTMAEFNRYYQPAVLDRSIEQFTLYTLKDGAERDDNCARIYNKSVLYLVSRAFEEKVPVPFREGTPLLGMERFLLDDAAFQVDRDDVQKNNPPSVPLLGVDHAEWIRSPNGLPEGSTEASHAQHHADFDDDRATVKSTLARILGSTKAPPVALDFAATPAALAGRRREVESAIC